jgi:hypothetical protein
VVAELRKDTDPIQFGLTLSPIPVRQVLPNAKSCVPLNRPWPIEKKESNRSTQIQSIFFTYVSFIVLLRHALAALGFGSIFAALH